MIESTPIMADLESYLLQRQSQVAAEWQAREDRGRPFGFAFLLLMSVVLFALGAHFFGVVILVYALVWLAHVTGDAYKEPLRMTPVWSPPKPSTPHPEVAFPSDGELLTLLSEADRILLATLPPRRVRIRRDTKHGYVLVTAAILLLSFITLPQTVRAARTSGSLGPLAVNILFFGFMVFLLGELVVELVRPWRQRRILAEGQTAIGLILQTEEAAGKRRIRKIWYDFRDGMGRVHRCSGIDHTKRAVGGSVLIVLYDRNESEKQVAYPNAPFEIVSSSG